MMTDDTSNMVLPELSSRTTSSLFELHSRALELAPLQLTPGRFLLGSDPACDLVVPASGVEPQHCLLLVGPRKVVVKALSPKTWIDDGAIREASLGVGQRLIVGPIELKLTRATAELPASHRVSPPQVPFAPQDIDDAIATLKQATPADPIPQTPVPPSLSSIEAFLDDYFQRRRKADTNSIQESTANAAQAADRELASARQQLQSQQADIEARQRELEERHQELDKERTRLDLRQFALNEQQQDVTDRAAAMASDRAAVRIEREQLERRRNELLEHEAALQQLQRNQRAEQLTLEQAQSQLQSQTREVQSKAGQLKVREQELAARQENLESLELQILRDREELHRLRSKLTQQQSALDEQQQDLQDRHEQLCSAQEVQAAEHAQLQTLRASLEEQEQRLNLQQEEFKNQQEQSTAARDTLAIEHQRLRDLQTTLEAKEYDLTQREEELRSRESTIAQQTADLDQRVARFEQSQSAWGTEQQVQVAAQEQQLRDEQARLQAWSEELTNRDAEVSKSLQDAQHVEALQQELESATTQLTSLRSELESQSQQLLAELATRDAELDQLRHAAQQLPTEDTSSTQKQNEELSRNNSELQDHVRTLEREQELLAAKLAELQSVADSHEALQSRCGELEQELRQAEDSEQKLCEVTGEHQALLAEQQHLTSLNEELLQQVKELQEECSHLVSELAARPSEQNRARTIESVPMEPQPPQSTASGAPQLEDEANHASEVCGVIEEPSAEPAAEIDRAESETGATESSFASDDVSPNVAEENEPTEAATGSHAASPSDASIHSLRSQLAQMFGLPEGETRHHDTDSIDPNPQPEENETEADQVDPEGQFESVIASMKPSPEGQSDDGDESFARNEVSGDEPSQVEPEDEAEHDDDPVATYMEQLLARMRGEGSGQASSASSGASCPAPAATSSNAMAASSSIPEPREASIPEEITADSAEQPQSRPLSAVQKNAMRANLDSFRELANVSARSAVATSQSVRLRRRFRTSLYISAASWGVSAMLLSAESWSDHSQQLPGLLLMLVATGISINALLSWLSLKRTDAAAAVATTEDAPNTDAT